MMDDAARTTAARILVADWRDECVDHDEDGRRILTNAALWELVKRITALLESRTDG